MIGRYTRQGIYLGIGLALPIIFLANVAVAPLLSFIEIDASFRDTTVQYVKAISWGAPGMFVFLALRFTTEGVGHTKPIMYTSVLALVVNVFLNWVFIYGKLGAPAMGAVGCGVASAITMWLIMVVLGSYMLFNRFYEPLKLFARVAPLRPEALREHRTQDIGFLGVRKRAEHVDIVHVLFEQ